MFNADNHPDFFGSASQTPISEEMGEMRTYPYNTDEDAYGDGCPILAEDDYVISDMPGQNVTTRTVDDEYVTDDGEYVNSDGSPIRHDWDDVLITPANYTYLPQMPVRINSDMAASIIMYYAAIQESRNIHVIARGLGKVNIMTTQNIWVGHVLSGYGRSTQSHYDDSDYVVHLRYTTTESAMEYEAVIGVLNGQFTLWMD